MSKPINLDDELIRSTLGFYNNSVIPRNAVQDIVEELIRFNSLFTLHLLQQLKLKSNNYNQQIKKDINAI